MLTKVRATINRWYDSARLKRARNIKIVDDQSFRQFAGIFNPETDMENPDWLNLLALVFDNTNHSDHNSEKAHTLFMRAAELGSAPAAYNLATRWLYGYYDKIDVERAKYWYGRAFVNGHGCAGASYASLVLSDPSLPVDGEDKRDALGILNASEAHYGGPWAVFYKAQLHASGFFGVKDPKEIIGRYLKLAGSEVCGPPRALATQALAFHAFLGSLFQEPEPEHALRYIESFPRDETESWVRNGVANSLDRLRHIIVSEIVPHRAAERQQGKNRLTLPSAHAKAYGVVQSVMEGQRNETDVLDDLDKGVLPSTRILADWLWAASTLSRIESDRLGDTWETMRAVVESRLLGTSVDAVRSSTAEFGIAYNAISKSGHPIPGAFLSPQTEKPHRFVDVHEAVLRGLPSSWGKLTGIRGRRNGTIELVEQARENCEPAYLFRQDLAVVLMLAFGENGGPVWPSLSIESIDKEVPERPRWSFEQKIWTPEWVGRSELGKTLYATDYWAGELALRKVGIDTAEIQDVKLRHQATELIKELAIAGGREDGLFNRIMLRPDKINWTWSRDKSGNQICDVHHIKMRVDGSEISITPDGVEDRSLHLNDTRFASGRVASLMTEHYETIASLWPMFERLRQLSGLMLATTELRKRKFRPSPKLMAWANEETSQLRGRPALRLDQRLVL